MPKKALMNRMRPLARLKVSSPLAPLERRPTIPSQPPALPLSLSARHDLLRRPVLCTPSLLVAQASWIECWSVSSHLG